LCIFENTCGYGAAAAAAAKIFSRRSGYDKHLTAKVNFMKIIDEKN
jgi:hypothetical protein